MIRPWLATTIGVMAGLWWAASNGASAIQGPSAGAPISIRLAPGATATRDIDVPAGTWLAVDVTAQHLDLRLTVHGPGIGEAIADEARLGGREALEVVATLAGPVTVAVSASADDGDAEVVSLRTSSRAATDDDRAHVSALEETRRRHTDAMQQLDPLLHARPLERPVAQALDREFDALARLWRSLGRPDLAVDALIYRARIHTTVFEDLAESKPLLEEALAMASADTLILGRAMALNDLAIVEERLGNPGASVTRLEEAVGLVHRVGDDANAAIQTSNLGLAYVRRGRYEEALARQREAAESFRRLGLRDREALTLSDLAGTWEALGETGTALDVQRQAVAAAHAAGNPLAEAVALGNLGRRLQRLQRFDDVRAPLEEALRLSRAIGNRRIESAMVAALGRFELDQGHADAALALADQARTLATGIANPVSEGVAWQLRGEALLARHDTEGAMTALGEALPRFEATSSSSELAETLRLRARIHLDASRLAEARADLVKAIDSGEATRVELLAPESRASYATTRDRVFADFVDVCLRQHAVDPGGGHAAAAVSAVERLRAASLRDLLAEARADVRAGGDPAVISREREVRAALESKSRALVSASARSSATALVASLTNDVAALQTELRVLERRLREGSPRYLALTTPEPLTAAEIQAHVVDEGTVLLMFVAGETRSWLIAVAHEGLRAVPLAPRRELDDAAREAAVWLSTTPGRRPLQSSRAALQHLSDLALGPIATELAGAWRTRRLAVVSSGALEYVPLGALPYPTGISGAPALGLAVEVVSLPSASVLYDLRRDLEGRPPARGAVAVVADPVFAADDPRVPVRATPAVAGGAPGTFARLPFTRDEAEAIRALTPAGSRFIATGFDATRDLVTTGGLAGYRLVHIATHGILDAERPQLSGLAFSMVDRQGHPRPGFLRTDAIFNVKVDADLVVLSGCETALGRALRGEGLTGLARAWMYAGAPRVVASLWRVDDAATASLMRHFYQGLLRDRLRPAAALAAAQRAVARVAGWRDPYYWAAFTLQGDWR